MKKYNYIIVSLLACLLTTSCNDYFDQVPDDRLSLKEIFTTRDGALRYLSNVYTFLPDEFNQRQVHETSLYRTPGPWTGASDEAEWTNDKKEKLINNTLSMRLKEQWYYIAGRVGFQVFMKRQYLQKM